MKGLLPILVLVLTACGAMEDASPDAAQQGDISRSALRVLQFVPADETEYPRQEATFNSPVDFSPAFVAATDGGIWNSGRYRLQRGIRLSGKVYTADDTLLGGRVRFQGVIDGDHTQELSLRRGEITTKQDSSYDVTLAPGPYLIDLIPDSASWPAQRQQAVNITENSSTADLRLQAGVNYRGTVSDATAMPLEGIAVRVISENGTLRSQTVTTGEDGSYRVSVGPDAEQTYRIEFAPRQADVLPRVIFGNLQANTEQELNIQYLPVTAQTVAGTVLGPDGEPAADISVALTASASQIGAARRVDTAQINDEGHANFQSRTDGNGSFEIRVPEGTWSYTLRLQPPIDQPFGGLVVSDFDLTAPVKSYTLPWKENVQGQVITDQGTPVQADIVIRKSIAQQESHQIVRAQADANGEFTANLDPAGALFDVTIIPRDGKSARCTRVGVNLSRFQETFIVRTGLRTEGYVADENGVPLQRVAVTLTELTTSGLIRTLAESEGSTDAEGRFKLLLPPEGTSGCR